MSFSQDFDTLLNAILTDYHNQFPAVDTSQGSLVFIKSACLASALWGLYKHQEWVAKQIFPDTADTKELEHHAWIRDLPRTAGETDAALLARILEYIRHPPAGGNRYDYIRWALSIDNVEAAWCFPLAQGQGTVDVVIKANATTTGSEIPSSYKAVTGTNTSATAYKLINSGATFQTAGIAAGDPVFNTTDNRESRVRSVDSQTQLTLVSDIFLASSKAYTIITKPKGTNTSVVENKLLDSAATFQTIGVMPGDVVTNTSTEYASIVVEVVSQTELSLALDIFTEASQAYALTSLARSVKDLIDDLRPVTASQVRVLGPTLLPEAVTMTVTGSNLDKTTIADSITTYMETLIPLQILYKSKLLQIALDEGADNAVVSTPATDITPTGYQMIRPGTISVT